MPFALVFIGLLMIVTGAKDTHKEFAAEVASEFTGPPKDNFIWWLVAFGAIGAVGYAPQFRTFSRAFMALLIIVILLANGGFFDQFTKALQSGPVAPNKAAATPEEKPLVSFDIKNSPAAKDLKWIINGLSFGKLFKGN